MGHHTFRIVGLSLLFAGFISFPLINSFTGLVKDTENTENRAMAKKPVFDINYLDPFPEQYEKYYNDHFSIRALTVKWFTYYNLRFYKKSPFDHVLIGNNGWLYLAGDQLACYQGTNRFTHEQLEAYRKDLEFQKAYLEKRGCKFYFMIAPCKTTIYTENMSLTYFRENKESPGEQLSNYLKKNSEIRVISVYEQFRKLKEDQLLYFKLDNHWNALGAFYAAQMACSEIATDLPAVQPLALSDFNVKQVTRKAEGDIVRVIGNPDFYKDTDKDYEFISKKTGESVDFSHANYALYDGQTPLPLVKDTKDPKKPKLMVIGDSFTYQFYPFFAQSFGKSINIFDGWQYKLFADIVEREKPDVYLLIAHETFALTVPDTRAWFKKQNIPE